MKIGRARGREWQTKVRKRHGKGGGGGDGLREEGRGGIQQDGSPDLTVRGIQGGIFGWEGYCRI